MASSWCEKGAIAKTAEGKIGIVTMDPDRDNEVKLRFIVEHEVPHMGRVREARPAPIMSGTPLKIHGGPPLYGEHTREVLEEHGWSAAEVDALYERGTLGPTAEQQRAARETRAKRVR